MIDINLIRNKPELVKENIRKKFQEQKVAYVDEIIELDKKVRELKKEGDTLRSQRNTLSGQIGSLMREKKVAEANEIKAQVVKINDRIVDLEKEEGET